MLKVMKIRERQVAASRTWKSKLTKMKRASMFLSEVELVHVIAVLKY